MKALRLNDELILKEVQRFIDRDNNIMEIRYSLRTLFGEISTTLPREFCVVVRKDLNEETWVKTKDMTTDQVIDFILENLDFELIEHDIETLVSGEELYTEGNIIKEAIYKTTKSNSNSEEFKLIEPFYISFFEVLKQFDNIRVEEI